MNGIPRAALSKRSFLSGGNLVVIEFCSRLPPRIYVGRPIQTAKVQLVVEVQRGARATWMMADLVGDLGSFGPIAGALSSSPTFTCK
jgi:hypothetical protein